MKKSILILILSITALTIFIKGYSQKISDDNLCLKLTLSLTDTVSLTIGQIEIFNNEPLFMDEILSRSATVTILDSINTYYVIEVEKSVQKDGENNKDLSLSMVVNRFVVKRFELKSITIKSMEIDQRFDIEVKNGRYFHIGENYDEHKLSIHQKKKPFLFK